MTLDKTAIAYADYAAWQRAQLLPETASFSGALEWWRELFTPAPALLALPFLRWRKFLRRKAVARPAEGMMWWGISAAASERLADMGRRNGATYFMTRLAAFLTFLAKTTGQEDLVLGTYATNRGRSETQKVFGYFANLAALRFAIGRGRSAEENLAEIKKRIGELQAPPRAEIPFEMLRELLKERGTDLPAPRAIFSTTEHTAPLHFGGVEMTWRERVSDAMPWGFTLSFDRHHEATANRAWFDARIYDPGKVREFLEEFSRFLEPCSEERR